MFDQHPIRDLFWGTVGRALIILAIPAACILLGLLAGIFLGPETIH